jgi:hypothetical protein
MTDALTRVQHHPWEQEGLDHYRMGVGAHWGLEEASSWDMALRAEL